MDAPLLAEEASPFAPGATVAGKYRVERELGAGGVGVVALATHVELGQRVAIKYLRNGRGANPRSLERFKREAKLAASLRSENVVKVFDVGTLPDGVPYMVMEYLEGEDLDAVIKRGPVPIEQAVQWTLEACDALQEAHELGIVHRDLKPANFFLARRPSGAPIVKILDFGISKIVDPGAFAGEAAMTRQNEIFGTPYYMSPEQLVSSANVDARGDIWAMGVCLYELLTGRLPFEGDDLRQLVADILSSSPQPIRDHRADIPVELAQIVHSCLLYDPEQRPRTIAAFAQRIAPYASGAYVRQLSMSETTLDHSGLHDLGWVNAGPPSRPPSIPMDITPAPKLGLIAAVGGASLLAGAALAVGILLARSPVSADQALVGAEAPREVVIALPSPATALPSALPAQIEIIEVPAVEPTVEPPRKEPPRPAASARPVRPPPVKASTDEFGGRQ